MRHRPRAKALIPAKRRRYADSSLKESNEEECKYMEEHNEENSISAVDSSVNVEEIKYDKRELIATPLKKYVIMVANVGNKWTSNFGCKLEPLVGRIHVLGLTSLDCYRDKELGEWLYVRKFPRKRGRK
ncbi:hypothetical protein Pfo_007316 [Paulownia fortunei]|nr:hypothetical protein Pfo_007316 [Paulownia fortunei]